MSDKEWQTFFLTAVDILGEGSYGLAETQSWCSWTTFGRLTDDAGYWTAGLPRKKEILETYIADSGIWGQPFSYSQLAHVIIPCEFYWEKVAVDKEFICGYRQQDINTLSLALKKLDIQHRATDRVLELKVY